MIINRETAAWESQQVQEPCILPNPKDPSRLVMFYSGVPKSNRKLCYFGKAWALKSDPFTWHQDEMNPVFGPLKDNWDSGSIRLDAVLYIPEDAYYIYYSGTTESIQDQMSSRDLPRRGGRLFGDHRDCHPSLWRSARAGSQPAAPYFEKMAQQAAVWREWDAAAQRWAWYMYYSYRGKDGTLPGLRLATSRDGKSWTRHLDRRIPRGMGQILSRRPMPIMSGTRYQKSATPTCSRSKSAPTRANAGVRSSR